MTSKAEALFTFKSFGSNGLPSEAPVVGISTVKRQGDATLSLQLNDSTLRDPKSLKGVVLAAEKPLGGGWLAGLGCAGSVFVAGVRWPAAAMLQGSQRMNCRPSIQQRAVRCCFSGVRMPACPSLAPAH